MTVSIPITALYVGLNALIMVVLAYRVSRARLKTGTALGHDAKDGDSRMIQAARAQGNNAEYVPMAMILLAVLEITAAPALILHALGAVFTLARVAHAYGLSTKAGVSAGRFYGTLFTWLVLVAGGGLCLYYAFTRM